MSALCEKQTLCRCSSRTGSRRPMCASASDTPCARQRGAWFQPDQSAPGSKCVWRTRHRFDVKTATLEVRKGVTTENHEVRIALVDKRARLAFRGPDLGAPHERGHPDRA